MIIGTDYVFVAVSKTGSISIRESLKKHPFVYDHDPTFGKYIPNKRISEFKNSHVPISMLMSEMDVSGHLKFGFTRNPWERFISYCAWTKTYFVRKDKTIISFENDPRKFLTMIMRKHKELENLTTMIWGTSRFLCDLNGNLAVDFVGRFETLQESYDEICSKIGIPGSKLVVMNKSNHKDYRSYYTPELYDSVSKLYETDIKMFNYKF